MESQNNLEVLNTRDVAKIMKCCLRKIQKLAHTGELPMKRFGKEYITTRQRLEEYLNK